MVKVLAILKPLMHGLLKLAGMTPQTVEIEPGTVMKFWVPSQTVGKKSIQTDSNKTIYHKPNKHPLVFAHPFDIDGMLAWFFQMLYFSNKYSVYVPDLIFFGDSITDKPNRSTDFQADCLATGLMKLGVDKCTLVGLSYGGMVGFKMAKLYPQLVESLVVCGTVVEFTESISNESLKRIGFSRWSDFLLPESVESMKSLISISTHKFPWLPDFVYRDFLEVIFNNRKERSELLDALVINDEEATTPKYSQRIRMLWGDDDKLFDLQLAQKINEQLGDKASMQYIKNAGHLLQLERPCVYNKRLYNILQSLKTDGQQLSTHAQFHAK